MTKLYFVDSVMSFARPMMRHTRPVSSFIGTSVEQNFFRPIGKSSSAISSIGSAVSTHWRYFAMTLPPSPLQQIDAIRAIFENLAVAFHSI